MKILKDPRIFQIHILYLIMFMDLIILYGFMYVFQMYVCCYWCCQGLYQSVAKIAEPRQGQTRLALARSTSQYSEGRWSLPECNFTSASFIPFCLNLHGINSGSQEVEHPASLPENAWTDSSKQTDLSGSTASKLPTSVATLIQEWNNPRMWNCSLCVSSQYLLWEIISAFSTAMHAAKSFARTSST